MGWWIGLAVVLTAVALWAYFTAQRLNRLHIRTDAALQNLHGALDRRDSLVAALLPELAEAAGVALAIPLLPELIVRRADADNEISQQLARLRSAALPAPVVDAAARVELAYRFYNDAVTTTRALRTRPLVRILRLGGTARLPSYFEVPALAMGQENAASTSEKPTEKE